VFAVPFTSLLNPSSKLESLATKLFEISSSVIVLLSMSEVVSVLSCISLLSTVPSVILSPFIDVMPAPLPINAFASTSFNVVCVVPSRNLKTPSLSSAS
jgi:hypothetical protein